MLLSNISGTQPPLPSNASSSNEAPPEQTQESTALETVTAIGDCITQWTSQNPVDLTLRSNIVLYLIQQPLYLDQVSPMPLRYLLGNSLFLLLKPLNLPEFTLTRCMENFSGESAIEIQSRIRSIRENIPNPSVELQNKFQAMNIMVQIYFPLFNYSVGCLMEEFTFVLEWLENNGFLGSESFVGFDLLSAFESEREKDKLTCFSITEGKVQTYLTYKPYAVLVRCS